jgi:hypothetical protein
MALALADSMASASWTLNDQGSLHAEWWKSAFDLSADAVRRISALGAGLGFDIYANLEDGDDG